MIFWKKRTKVEAGGAWQRVDECLDAEKESKESVFLNGRRQNDGPGTLRPDVVPTPQHPAKEAA
jgi:hypothetical protein